MPNAAACLSPADTRRYDFVQQLETDCCALAPGWLEKALEPLLELPEVAVSGGVLPPGGFVFNSQTGGVDPVSSKPLWVQKHVNGNAMYRVGGQLQQLLEHSIAHHTSWPFDLALWRSVRDLKLEERLHSNEHVSNVYYPVDKELFQVLRALKP